MPALDQPGADRQLIVKRALVVELFDPVGQIAVRKPHRRIFLGGCRCFEVLPQLLEHLVAAVLKQTIF